MVLNQNGIFQEDLCLGKKTRARSLLHVYTEGFYPKEKKMDRGPVGFAWPKPWKIHVFVKNLNTTRMSAKATEAASMNSGVTLGPPLSVSKNLIIPIEELGPEIPESLLVNFIETPKHFCRQKFIYHRKVKSQFTFFVFCSKISL